MSEEQEDKISDEEWLSITCLHATKEDIEKASDELIRNEMDRLVEGGEHINALCNYVTSKVEGMTEREVIAKVGGIEIDCSDELIDLSVRDIRAKAWINANASTEDLEPFIYEIKYESICEAETQSALQHYLEMQVADICSSKDKAIEYFIEANDYCYGDLAEAAERLGWEG